MAKIPVVKTVQRNGQVHTQTYWEDDDKSGNQPSLLASLGVSIKPSNTRKEFPRDQALEDNWRVIMGNGNMDDAYVEAAIAAGLTFGAADHIASSLPEWESLSDHIYENGLDEMPRPKGGWVNRTRGFIGDQRSTWISEEIPLETAVEWIDGGFPYPWSGVPQLIQAGLSLERAQAWSADMAAYGKTEGKALYLASKELLSDISLEDAKAYRKAFYGESSRYLGTRELEFYKAGIDPANAARWSKVTYEEVDVSDINKLRELKWSPSSVKSIIKDLYGATGRQAMFGKDVAEMLVRVTPELGPKVMQGWAKVVRSQDVDAEYTPQIIEQIKDAENFKARALAETGVEITPDDHHNLSRLLPLQREAYIALMNAPGREHSVPNYRVSRTMELARFVGSAENVKFLQDKGFMFGDPETGKPIETSYTPMGYDTFNAATASEEARNRWMKDLSFHLYSTKTRQQESRERFLKDDSIDPIRLRDAIINDPTIDDLRLEALVVNNIASPVADGWL